MCSIVSQYCADLYVEQQVKCFLLLPVFMLS